MDLNILVQSTCFAHSRQVSKISALLAEHAGYAPNETSLIGQAALYHDIGKTEIPASILNKPGALTSEEFALVKTHTTLGFDKINETIDVLTIAADVCRDHHERPDGAGYGGISESRIHPYTKLITVADVFDALYSKRAYKEPWGIEQIRSFFHEQSGTQFDAGIVLLLFSILDEVLTLYHAENA